MSTERINITMGSADAADFSLENCLAVLQDETQGDGERSRALSQLEEQGEALESVQLLHTLTQRLKVEQHVDILRRSIQLLARLQAVSAVMSLIDIALAHNVRFFEPNPTGPPDLESDAVVRLRCAAVRALGLLGDGRAIIPLMSLLNDRYLNYRVRLEAAESLGRLGDKHAVPPLLNIMEDERESSLYLKESAVKALGMLDDIRAVEPLIAMFEAKRGLKQKFEFFLEKIVESIGRLGQSDDYKVLNSLTQASLDEASSIRLAAVEALGQLGNPEVMPVLQARLFDEHMDVARCALAGVYKLGQVAALEDLLANEKLPQFLRSEINEFLSDLDAEPNEDED